MPPATPAADAQEVLLPGQLVARYRYWPILALLTASLTWTMLGDQSRWAGLVSVALQGGTLVMALINSGRPVRVLQISIVTMAVLALVALVAVASGTRYGLPEMTEAAVSLVAAAAIFAGLIRQMTVTMQSIAGALCVYLLLGLFFASFDQAVASLSQIQYFSSRPTANASEFTYFSFVTLATLGYGDFTPATSVGRLLAVIEALSGQLYLVSVVALVVGNVGRTRPGRGQ
jgi:hypothetical protein